MAKLQLKVNPTFEGAVQIPLKDGTKADINFTFRHRGRVALVEFVERVRKSREELQPDPEKQEEESAEDRIDRAKRVIDFETKIVMEVAEGWNLEEPFNLDEVRYLLNEYFGAAGAIYDCYMEMSQRVATGNSAR